MRLSPLLALALAGCHAPFGTSVRVTTPKPFAEPQLGTYEIRPDAELLRLARPLNVAVLPFSDGRRLKHPGVDRIWSADAESRQGRIVQPRELRGIVRRGLENGLKRWTSIRLVHAEELGVRKDAEVFVSGTIDRCRVSASFVNYRSDCALSVHVRDADGVALLDQPVAVRGRFSKRIYERPADWRSVEPVPPNPLAPAVERALENALNELLSGAPLRAALKAAADRPG
jgi:hypothetical protein